NAKPP
uniref:Cryptide Pep-24 n=1 Tax=Tityus obscurus TaxID=1221240 RepID=CRY24_TITOB